MTTEIREETRKERVYTLEEKEELALAHYDCISETARRIGRRFGLRTADIEDVVQEKFIRCLELFKDPDPSRFRRYTTTSVKNELINLSRKLAKSRRENAEIPEKTFIPEKTPLEIKEQWDRLKMIAGEFFEPLYLFQAEGLTYEEIASKLNVPVGTIMSRIHRAREKIKREFDEFGSVENYFRGRKNPEARMPEIYRPSCKPESKEIKKHEEPRVKKASKLLHETAQRVRDARKDFEEWKLTTLTYEEASFLENSHKMSLKEASEKLGLAPAEAGELYSSIYKKLIYHNRNFSLEARINATIQARETFKTNVKPKYRPRQRIPKSKSEKQQTREEFADYISGRLKTLEITQRELAKRAGLNEITISHYMSRRRTAGESNKSKIYSVLEESR